MSKYKITRCPANEQLVDTEFEAVIIKNMALLNLVKKIASDVKGIKTDVADLKVRVTKLENRMDNFENVIKLNNLRTE